MHCYVRMRACMHLVLRRSADACLIVPISADHPGGAARCHAVRVVRAGPPLLPQPGIRGVVWLQDISSSWALVPPVSRPSVMCFTRYHSVSLTVWVSQVSGQ